MISNLYYQNPKALFNDMWLLVRHYNFSPEFVNELPPVEREMYIAMGEKEEKELEDAMGSQQSGNITQ